MGESDHSQVQAYQTGSAVVSSSSRDATGGFSNTRYASTTKNQTANDSFQTFCIERTEYHQHRYIVQCLDQHPRRGGWSVWPESTPPPFGDPVSQGTGWLYSQFATGTLAGYNYDAGRSGAAGSSADLLQQTIWWLEGESALRRRHQHLRARLSSESTAPMPAWWTTIGVSTASTCRQPDRTARSALRIVKARTCFSFPMAAPLSPCWASRCWASGPCAGSSTSSSTLG